MDDNPLKTELVTELLKCHFKEKNTKANSEAQKLSADLLCTFIYEAAYRSAAQTKNEDGSIVDLHHFEKIFPKLMMDF